MYRVKDILDYKGTDIWSVKPEASMQEALKLLEEKDIGALLVLEGSQLVGIISERDFVRGLSQTGQCDFDQPVSSVMTREVVTVNGENTIDDCMKMMTQGHFRHLPVVNKQGQLEGMISIGDVMKQVISQRESTIAGLESYIEGQQHQY